MSIQSETGIRPEHEDLVSIIMPSYNTEKYIAKSIKSVLTQTYQNWELLIVDDCSTDNTDKVVEPYLADSRIRFFRNEQNSGAAVSRNRALREAKGRWIAFLDSDDLWKPEKLHRQINFMQENNYHFYMMDLTIFIMLAMCYSPWFRKMSDFDFRLFICDIFAKPNQHSMLATVQLLKLRIASETLHRASRMKQIQSLPEKPSSAQPILLV